MSEQLTKPTGAPPGAAKSSPVSFSDAAEKWIQFVFERGPITVLASGGALALGRGLLPAFVIREATFGASLLVIAAIADVFIWVVKIRADQRRLEQTGKQLDAARDVDQKGRRATARGFEQGCR